MRYSTVAYSFLLYYAKVVGWVASRVEAGIAFSHRKKIGVANFYATFS